VPGASMRASRPPDPDALLTALRGDFAGTSVSPGAFALPVTAHVERNIESDRLKFDEQLLDTKSKPGDDSSVITRPTALPPGLRTERNHPP
jgi:hypothetical protein